MITFSCCVSLSVIVLRGGIHFVGTYGPLLLTSDHSHTRFVAYVDEQVWLSGGVPLDGVDWQKHSDKVWKATVPETIDQV